MMKTQSAKSKGRLLQKLVASQILEHSTNLTDNDVTSRPMGSQGSDVMLSEAALTQWPFDIECKNLKSGFTKLYDAIEQSEARSDKVPLVVIKQNRKTPLVCLRIEHFMDIIEKLNVDNAT